jgi:hypothetical protein
MRPAFRASDVLKINAPVRLHGVAQCTEPLIAFSPEPAFQPLLLIMDREKTFTITPAPDAQGIIVDLTPEEAKRTQEMTPEEREKFIDAHRPK